MTRDEWIKRAISAGAPSEDYADSLYMAYTDDGDSDMSPEQIVAEDAAIGGRTAYKPQWRAECVYVGGWGAKRWAVRFVDGGGNVVDRLMQKGKERTFLAEHRAEAEAVRRNKAMLSNAGVVPQAQSPETENV